MKSVCVCVLAKYRNHEFKNINKVTSIKITMSNGRYQLVELPGRFTYHHIGSSVSTSSMSWIEQLRRASGNQNLVCAVFRCTEPAYLGAHIRPTEWEIFKRHFSLGRIGGIPIIPCCRAHHNTRGAPFRTKRTIAIIDKEAPTDNSGYRR